jgi:acetyl esterase/lipase
VSPVFGDLRDLPPTLLIVGAADVLLEDNLVMAARLSAAGGEVDLRIYPESPHGFTGHPTSMARAALDDQESWLADHLTARAPCPNAWSGTPHRCARGRAMQSPHSQAASPGSRR